MISFEDYRKDKEFKIDSLTYQEIFESLKCGIEKAICDFKGIEKLDQLKLDGLDNHINMCYGADKDMYPRVVFMVEAYSSKWKGPAFCYCVINPFEVELHVTPNGRIEVIECEELTQALIDMINEKFPNSDYMEKREKYFKMAELIERKREELLFF